MYSPELEQHKKLITTICDLVICANSSEREDVVHVFKKNILADAMSLIKDLESDFNKKWRHQLSDIHFKA